MCASAQCMKVLYAVDLHHPHAQACHTNRLALPSVQLGASMSSHSRHRCWVRLDKLVVSFVKWFHTFFGLSGGFVERDVDVSG